MYHPNLVAENRAKLEAHFRRPLKEFTYCEVEDFRARMKDVAWEEGVPSRALSQEEQEYIWNESQMCRISFDYWCRRYCTILADDKRMKPLVPWPSQEILFKTIGEEEVAGYQDPERRKIRTILLKSRQIGGTVGAEALVAHMVFLNPRTQGIIASDHPDNSLNLWQALIRMYDYLPGWMKPHRESKVRGQRLSLDRIISDVVVGAGNQKTTLGQGMNVDMAHLTEVSSWDYPRYIDADLMPAFNSSQKHHSLIILESTGSGAQGNWFHDQFQAARSGDSLFKALFIAWYLRPGWSMRADGVEFTPDTIEMAERVKREAGYDLSREQMTWWQWQKKEYTAKDQLEVFYQEFPSTIEEAFQTGFRSIFPIDLRAKLRNKVRQPVAVYEVRADLPKPLAPVDSLSDWLASERANKADNRLIIWEPAARGYTYVVGVDASYGIDGGDSSAIEVIRVGNKWLPDEQVAEYRGTISPLDLAKVVEMVGKIYKDPLENFEAMVACEVNPGSPGYTTQSELIRMGYPHFYRWRKQIRVDGGWTNEVGWWTTPSTRPTLIDTGEEYVKKGWLRINSPFLINEMNTFVNTKFDKGGYHIAHAPGYHDDRIMALFIAITCAHQNDRRLVAEDRAKALEDLLRPPEKVVQFQELGITWQEAMRQWEAKYLDS